MAVVGRWIANRKPQGMTDAEYQRWGASGNPNPAWSYSSAPTAPPPGAAAQTPNFNAPATDYSDLLEGVNTGVKEAMSILGEGPKMPTVSLIDYKGLISDMSPEMEATAASAVGSALGLAHEQRDANLDWINKVSPIALAHTQDAYEKLSQTITSAAMATLDKVDPAWQSRIAEVQKATDFSTSAITEYMLANLPEAMASGADIARQHDKLTKSLMAGEVPEDVQRQISSRAAETSQRFGIHGTDARGAARAMEARDLGLSSLAMTQLGARMSQDSAVLWGSPALLAASMATQAQAGAAGMAKLISELKLNETPDINAIYKQQQDQLVAAGQIDPTRVFDAAMSQYNNLMGWGVDVAKMNQDTQTSYDSMILASQTDLLGAKLGLAGTAIGANAMLGSSIIGARAMTDAATINANAIYAAAQAQGGSGGGSSDGGAITRKISFHVNANTKGNTVKQSPFNNTLMPKQSGKLKYS